MSIFSRRRDQPEDPQAIIDRLAAQSGVPAGYAGPVTAGGEPGVAPPLDPIGPGTGFLLTVEDVFVIKGRGLVVTGRIASGQAARGMSVVINRGMQRVGALKVVGIETAGAQTDTASAGDTVGLLLPATDRFAVHPGDVLTDR